MNIIAAYQNAGLSNNPELEQQLYKNIQDMLTSERWESRLGGLKAATCLISTAPANAAFQAAMLQACSALLEDSEVRVRWAVGELLRALSETMGITVWDQMEERIISSIMENFVRFLRWSIFSDVSYLHISANK